MAKSLFDLREAWETQKGIETKRKANTDVEEAASKFTDKQIKMAYGIINDPRWKSGNMTSIVRRIEGIAKGLSKHPGVQKALQVTNEEVQVDEAKGKLVKNMRVKHIHNGNKGTVVKGGDRAGGRVEVEYDNGQTVMVAGKYLEPLKESVELDEAAPKISTGKAKGSIKATGLRGKGMKKFDVDVAVKNGKFEFRISDESGKFQTVGIKQAARMLGESVDLAEAKEPASPDEGSMAVRQLEFMYDAIEDIMEHIEEGGDFPEWMQNKLTEAHTKIKDLYASVEGSGDDEEDEMDEARKYTPPTKAEIEADKKKDRKADRAAGKARPSVTAKSITKRLYGR